MKSLFDLWRSEANSPNAQQQTTKLILGLGNPGPQYTRHRHNVGFQCLDTLAHALNVKFEEGHKVARLAKGEVDGTPVVLAKPSTFVNKSGEAAAALAQRYRLKPQDIIVIYDDLDLPLGRIRIRASGSSGGHNGLKSIIDHLHSEEFPRVRVGIGRPPRWDNSLPAKEREDEIIRWVLSGFPPEDEAVMATKRDIVAQAVRAIITEGVTPAMNRFNNDKNFV